MQLSAKDAACLLLDIDNDFGGDRVNFFVGQSLFGRLQSEPDGNGFFVRAERLPLIDVEDARVGDQVSIDRASGAQNLVGTDRGLDYKREVAMHRLEG